MDLQKMIRVVEDFPETGISFKDITPLLRDAKSFQFAIDQFVAYGRARQVDVVVGPEARGFVIAAPLAYALGVGFVPIRKPGKLPAGTLRKEYALEYGKDALEIHRDAIHPGDRILIVDDLLATGGTISASVDLVEQLGGTVTGMCFLIELLALHGRDRLRAYDVNTLIQYE